MPGPVSDSYDPEFSTGANAQDVREAIIEARDLLAYGLGDLKNIVQVVHGKEGQLRAITLSERQRRVVRFALNRAIESI
jgi:hypothetical protein